MQADRADDVPAAEEQPAPESPPAAEDQSAPGSPPALPAALGQPVELTLGEQKWIQEEEKQSSDAFRYEIS